jgi:xanthine dehydrogenase accessory factor
LRDKGIGEAVIGRIHAPIGIDIGANTPAEIALSIAAELVAVRSGTEIHGMQLEAGKK